MCGVWGGSEPLVSFGKLGQQVAERRAGPRRGCSRAPGSLAPGGLFVLTAHRETRRAFKELSRKPPFTAGARKNMSTSAFGAINTGSVVCCCCL